MAPLNKSNCITLVLRLARIWVLVLLLAGLLVVPQILAAQLQTPEALSPALRRHLLDGSHLSGPPLTDAALRKRVVVVTFFASWCPPCRVELAELKKLYAELAPRGLTVVAVNYFETFDDFSNPQRLAAFLKRMALPFHVVEGTPAAAKAFGPVRRIPTLLAFDRQGRLALRFFNSGQGPTSMDEQALRQALLKLL